MASSILILALASAFIICVFACPPEQLVRPCHCRFNSIVCDSITGQDILDGVFRRIGDFKSIEFILKNSTVEYIPISSIERNNIGRIIILDSAIDQLFDRNPSTMNEVVHIRLENVTFQNGLSVSQIEPMHYLESLLVKDTEIPVMEQEFSQSLGRRVKLVSFINTKTRSINMAFVGKADLEDIRITNNSITTLNRVSFPYPSYRLQGFSFDGNQIETLPDDIFTMMTTLRRVSLADNRISQVPESVFGTVFDQLKFLILHGNPIKCDCSIKWLTVKNKEGKTITGKCAEPQSLEGRNIADLKPSDLPNC